MRVAEDNFMHRGQGIRQIVNAFQMFANVIGVEHRVLGGLPDPGDIRKDVSERAQQYTEISRESLDPTDRIRADRLERQPPAFFLNQDWNGAKRLQDFLHSHWTGTRTATAVWSRKCLVQIQVHHIDTQISGARDTREGVHVRAVHVKQRSLGVQDLRDLRYALLENS